METSNIIELNEIKPAGSLETEQRKRGRPRKISFTETTPERLEEIEQRISRVKGWEGFFPWQKKALILHVAQPHLSKPDLAKVCNAKISDICALFNSPEFSEISIELAKVETKELVQLAVKTVREMLLCKAPSVRLAAARMVLNDVGIFVDGEQNADRSFSVNWNETDNTLQPTSLSKAGT